MANESNPLADPSASSATFLQITDSSSPQPLLQSSQVSIGRDPEDEKRAQAIDAQLVEIESQDRLPCHIMVESLPRRYASLTGLLEAVDTEPFLTLEQEDPVFGTKSQVPYFELADSAQVRRQLFATGLIPIKLGASHDSVVMAYRAEKAGIKTTTGDLDDALKSGIPILKNVLSSAGISQLAEITLIPLDGEQFSRLQGSVSSAKKREGIILDSYAVDFQRGFAEYDDVSIVPFSTIALDPAELCRRFHFTPPFEDSQSKSKVQRAALAPEGGNGLIGDRIGYLETRAAAQTVGFIDRLGLLPIGIDQGAERPLVLGFRVRDGAGLRHPDELRDDANTFLLHLQHIFPSVFPGDVGPAQCVFVPISEQLFARARNWATDAASRKRELHLIDVVDGVRNYLTVIEEAAKLGASDIHIETSVRGPQVRYRIDGVLHPAPFTFSDDAFNKMVGALRTACKMKDPYRNEDGALNFPVLPDDLSKKFEKDGLLKDDATGKDLYPRTLFGISLRGSYSPTKNTWIEGATGKSFVFRLHRGGTIPSLAGLGLAPHHRGQIEKLFGLPSGIVIVTGPTGSGKSTLCYAGIMTIDRASKKVSSVEDPVETLLPGLVQQEVNPARDVTFETALKSFLRQDPEVLFVGETRETVVANLALQASRSGHLVITTLHANDAVGAIARMADYEINPLELSTSLKGIAAQRLVRKLITYRDGNGRDVPDPATSESHDVAAELNELTQSELFTEPVMAWREIAGLGADFGFGFKGRIPIIEILPISKEHVALLARGERKQEAYRQVTATSVHGFEPMVMHGMREVLAGRTTLAEVVDEIPSDQWVEYRERIHQLTVAAMEASRTAAGSIH